jgi:hypothetical protein
VPEGPSVVPWCCLHAWVPTSAYFKTVKSNINKIK